MTTDRGEQGFPGKPPVSELPDILVHRHSIMTNPTDAYYYAGSIGYYLVDSMESGAGAGEDMTDEYAYGIALEEALLHSGIFDGQEKLREVEEGRFGQHRAIRQEKFAEMGVRLEDVEAKAAEITHVEIIDHYMGKLEDWTSFLESGARPANWPELAADSGNGLLDMMLVSEIHAMAETVYTSMHVLGLGDGMTLEEGVAFLGERYAPWLERTCKLLFEHGRIGVGAPLINTVRRIDSEQVLIDSLCLALKKVQEEEGDESYRRLYGFIAQILNEPYESDFTNRMSRSETPLIHGSVRHTERIGDTLFLTECFEEGEVVYARLANGKQISLPHREFRIRMLMNYGQPTEQAMFESQSSVNYEDLEDGAKEAIEIARQIEEDDLLKVETMPRFKRLVLKPDEAGSTLHTIEFRDGFYRKMHRYPDDHGMVTSDTQPHVDTNVSSLTPVFDSWVALPYDGSYVSMAGYRDAEINFFAPESTRANSFWIMGNARIVHDKSGNPNNMKPNSIDGMPDRARWIVLPVRFFDAEVTKLHADYDDEQAFFSEIVKK